MTIYIFILKGDLNGEIVVVRFFFCRVYDFESGKNILDVCDTMMHLHFILLFDVTDINLRFI